jgi:hypothetical protein
MYHTMVGAPREALPIVEQAQPAAERLGAGLWKHRTRFMLGEPLLSLGRFGDAARAFREAALLSRGADPPVVGLANAFAALADLRQGAVEAALALVDGPSGAVLCDGSAARMQRFTVLGLQAEIRLGADRIEEAWESALCAEDAYGWPCDVFFAAFHAHAALCDVYLRLWWWVGEGRLPTTFPADQRALARRAVRAWRRLRRFALLYPGARPATDYWGARVAAMLSRRRRAARLAGRSLLRARAMGLPVEERLARSLLERGYAPEPAAAAASEPGFLPPSTSEAIDDHRVDNRIHPTV